MTAKHLHAQYVVTHKEMPQNESYFDLIQRKLSKCNTTIVCFCNLPYDKGFKKILKWGSKK